jgi:hypothetical protein
MTALILFALSASVTTLLCAAFGINNDDEDD